MILSILELLTSQNIKTFPIFAITDFQLEVPLNK
jgi:hypothetical protein